MRSITLGDITGEDVRGERRVCGAADRNCFGYIASAPAEYIVECPTDYLIATGGNGCGAASCGREKINACAYADI